MEQEIIQDKKRKQFRAFTEICAETAKEINGRVKTTQGVMWDIGKIIFKKRNEVNPKYGEQFLAGIADRMESEPSIGHLRSCECFYERFKDLRLRQRTYSLTVTHYYILSQYTLTDEETKKFEQRASKESWNSKRLLEEIRKYLGKEFTAMDMARRFHSWFGTGTMNANNFLELNLRDLDEVHAEGLLTEIGVMAFETLPKLARGIANETKAKPDPRIMRLIKLSR